MIYSFGRLSGRIRSEHAWKMSEVMEQHPPATEK
jgi:hypothetical protein